MFPNSASSQRFFQPLDKTSGQCKYPERCVVLMCNDTGGKFVAGVNDQWCSLTCEYRNHPYVEIRGLRKGDS